jgi:hypothetical protein
VNIAVNRDTINNENFFRASHPVWWLLCGGGMCLTYYIGCTASIGIVSPVRPVYHFAMMIFQTQQVVQWVFIIASLVHVAEAVYAFFLAGRKGCSLSRQLMWFAQTLCLGVPSLSILMARPAFSRDSYTAKLESPAAKKKK